MSSCPRKPNLIAMGRNIISNSISLQKDAATVGPSFLIALAPSKEAPMERSASGVVRLPRVLNPDDDDGNGGGSETEQNEFAIEIFRQVNGCHITEQHGRKSDTKNQLICHGTEFFC